MRALIPALVIGLTSVAHADVAADLKAFLGNRSGKIVARDRALGDKLYLFDLDTGQLTKISDDIDCRSPQISPDGKQVTYFQNDAVHVRALGGTTKTKVADGYDPHWWTDDTGETWIYYTTQGSFSSSSRKLWWPNNNGVKTYRIRLKDDNTEHLWDWKGSGGPSKDGKFIGAGYATMILYDTTASKAWLLSDETQGCNASLYPGVGKYYLMHLELPHDTFCYRDKDDNRVWYVLKPAGTEEWQNPEWSSDVDYAIATAKETNTYYSTWVVKISDIDGKTGKIKSGAKGMLEALSTAGGHDWAEPYLWVASPTLSLSPTSLSFAAEQGAIPAAQPVTASNSGSGDLATVAPTVSFDGGEGWLLVTASGTGNNQTLDNTVEISGLSPGSYSATVSVAASGAGNSPRSYTVSLTVSAPTEGGVAAGDRGGAAGDAGPALPNSTGAHSLETLTGGCSLQPGARVAPGPAALLLVLLPLVLLLTWRRRR